MWRATLECTKILVSIHLKILHAYLVEGQEFVVDLAILGPDVEQVITDEEPLHDLGLSLPDEHELDPAHEPSVPQCGTTALVSICLNDLGAEELVGELPRQCQVGIGLRKFGFGQTLMWICVASKFKLKRERERNESDRQTDFWRAEEEEEKQMDDRTNYKLGFVSVVRLGNLQANPGWLAVDRAEEDFIHGYPGLAGSESSGSIDVDDVHR